MDNMIEFDLTPEELNKCKGMKVVSNREYLKQLDIARQIEDLERLLVIHNNLHKS